MKHYLVIVTCIFILGYSCTPTIGVTISHPQMPLGETDVVVVVQKEENFEAEGVEVGMVRTADRGLSIHCSYEDIVQYLIGLSRKNGANLVKITGHKPPDYKSTCHRITAALYRVPQVHKYEKEIAWSASRKLKWEDFKGTPKSEDFPDVAAQTYCGFGFRTNRITIFKNATIIAQNIFDCSQSWVRPDQKYREDLLEHEQTHFDLCEVYARQLRKALLEKKLTVFNLNKETSTVYEAIFKQYVARQQLYEKETGNGLKKEEQARWSHFIALELEALHQYQQ